MIQRFDRPIFICILLLIVALPISIAGVVIFASLAAFLFLVKRILAVRVGEKFFGTLPESIVLPALVFFTVCAVSVCFSEAPDLGVKALVGKILQGIFLLFAVIDVVTTRKRMFWLLGVFATTAFLVTIDGLWQVGRGFDFIRGNLFDNARVAACMKHPNDFGTYLLFPVIMSMGILLWAWFEGGERYDRLRPKVGMLAVLLFGLSVVVLGLTYSRGAWLGALVGIFVFVIMRRKYLWVSIGLVVAFGVFFSPRMTVARNVSFVSDSAASQVSLTVASINHFTGSDRLNMWKDAARIIKDHPVIGTGLNTYTRVIYRYSDCRKLYAHNSYLQMTAELGFLGLAAFIWLLLSVGFFAFRRIVLLKDTLCFSLMAGLFGAWIGFLVQSGLDTTFYSVQLSRLLWLAMGLLVAGSMAMGKENRSC